MRLLLLFAVVIAVIVLLWGSWQWGRRAFLITVLAVVTGLSALLYGMFQESANDQVLLAPEGLELAVSDIRESESGVRLSGSLTNAGELDLAAVDVQIQALACPTAGECRVVYQEQQRLQMYVPAGRQYPFAVVSRHPPDQETVDRWQLRPVARLVYPSSR